MQLSFDHPGPLTELARTHGWIATSYHIDALSPAGSGNMNVVLRAQLGSGGTLIFKQSLPFVAKYPQIAAPIDRLNFESEFYKAIATDDQLAAATPEIIGFDPDSHILCMADLGVASDLLSLYQQTTTETQWRPVLQTLLQWLNRLHQHTLAPDQKDRFANPAMRQLNHEHIFVIPLQAENGLTFSTALMDFAAALRNDGQIRRNIEELGRLYLAAPSDSMATSQGCLLHGDFYPASWVRGDDGRLCVIDPEFCFCGPAEFDVGVMWAHLTFSGLSQADIQSALSEYQGPDRFCWTTARQFAAVEIIRRILGVAQLPWKDASAAVVDEQKGDWLTWAQAALRMGEIGDRDFTGKTRG